MTLSIKRPRKRRRQRPICELPACRRRDCATDDCRRYDSRRGALYRANISTKCLRDSSTQETIPKLASAHFRHHATRHRVREDFGGSLPCCESTREQCELPRRGDHQSFGGSERCLVGVVGYICFSGRLEVSPNPVKHCRRKRPLNRALSARGCYSTGCSSTRYSDPKPLPPP